MYSALDKTKNNPQTERLGVACGQLQLLTGNYCPRKKIVVLMGQRRVRQTAVARGQKQLTSFFWVVEVASDWEKPLSQSLKCFLSRGGA